MHPAHSGCHLIVIGKVKEIGKQAEIFTHGEQEEWQGENDADDEQTALFADFAFAGKCFSVLRLTTLFDGLESSLSQ